MVAKSELRGRGWAVVVGVVVGSLSASWAWAQAVSPIRPEDYERHSKPLEPTNRAAPVELPEREIPESVDTAPLTEAPLKGLRFVSKSEDVVEAPTTTGVEVQGLPLLDSPEFRGRVEPFLGQKISWRLISQIIRQTILYYRSQDRPVVEVLPPEQDITNGVVQLLVIEARVGQIRVEGLKWFSPELIRRQLHLAPGDVIRTKPLLAEIDSLNNNPFRFLRPVLEPGKEFGTTDVVLDGKDRFPIRFYMGYDDTGSRATGLGRFFFGFNMGNAFGQGHEAGYQYTTNTRFHSLGIHSAYYRIPLPNRDTLALFGNVSCYRYDHTSEGKLDSHNWMAHVRYITELPGSYDLRHELEVGFDYRQLDNDLQFGGVTAYDDFIDVAQWALQYGGRWKDAWGDTSWTANVYWSPCSDFIGGHQNDEAYGRVRPGAQATYVYTHLSVERLWVLPKAWSVFNRVTGQIASDRLSPSEQLGLGGYNRVRGYDDFERLADNGLMATVELRTPEWRLGTLDKAGKFEHFLQLLAFCDYGWGHNRGRYPSDLFKTVDLLSAGPGMRYRINHNLQVRFDFGTQLERIPAGKSDHRCNLSVILSY